DSRHVPIMFQKNVMSGLGLACRACSPARRPPMRLFLIAYDLARSSPHKHAIAAAIMNLGQAWARPLETTWYVRSESSEGEIQHGLAGLLDPEDGLIVQPVSEGAAMANTALRWFRRKKEDAH